MFKGESPIVANSRMTGLTPPTAASLSPAAARALPVVLDSNVWLDILVFDDPHTRPIRVALERGAIQALIDARCQAELAHVLDYPQFAGRGVAKAHALAAHAGLVELIELPELACGARPLPQCRDRDDQKFLELARASGAQWLVSKDRAVLKLAKRVARDFGFRIATPDAFVAECVQNAAQATRA
ncbi:putative PIN family toxin of toxin-antitoxin system [Paraburkholderia silvatlantica]|nr:putative PIN family toxin of toxin-antitoxin system [Paraburkholderia silvatlantica]PXW33382.1 putative PIN family toxin of toxin-antitoxin system [Paraburkholderia silvatlantica]PYE18944.1 putative PIN family toxin of toxin-antitoxin system [Paraburkholderia silvatlantica]TDQ83769.1 putative PIN family toxin of toxin-antitoxin system [Paraburkholderia silvatlantica]